MTVTSNDLKQILLFRLSEMTERNPRFSLRALAKRLNVSPSHLSRVLRGRKQFSYEMTTRLVRELDLSAEQSARVLREFETSRKSQGMSMNFASRDQREKQILDLESFRLIADWYHFPLLELIRIKGFQANEKWMARRLSLPHPVMTAALRRLERLGFIERAKGTISLKENKLFKTPDDIHSVAIRRHHEQMLQKANEALESQSTEVREFQGLNLIFDPSDTEMAKKIIRNFVRDFNKAFSKESGEEVYQLNVQFFALTKETS